MAAAQSVTCRSFAADKVNNARFGPAEMQLTVMPVGNDGDFMLLKKEKKIQVRIPAAMPSTW